MDPVADALDGIEHLQWTAQIQRLDELLDGGGYAQHILDPRLQAWIDKNAGAISAYFAEIAP